MVIEIPKEKTSHEDRFLINFYVMHSNPGYHIGLFSIWDIIIASQTSFIILHDYMLFNFISWSVLKTHADNVP